MFFTKIRNIVYPVNPFLYIKWGFRGVKYMLLFFIVMERRSSSLCYTVEDKYINLEVFSCCCCLFRHFYDFCEFCLHWCTCTWGTSQTGPYKPPPPPPQKKKKKRGHFPFLFQFVWHSALFLLFYFREDLLTKEAKAFFIRSSAIINPG